MLSFRRKYDADGSGAIDRDEFKRFLAHRYNIVLNEYEFHKLMGDIDPDGSGEIDYQEFFDFFQQKIKDPALWGSGSEVSWQMMKGLKDQMDKMWSGIDEAFRAIDLDGSGTIEYGEFQDVLTPWFDMEPEQCKAIFNKFDDDGSGEITYEEFADGPKLCPHSPKALNLRLTLP